jgi:hypothetical protein
MFDGFWTHLTYQSGVLAAWVNSIATAVLIVGLILNWLAIRASARAAMMQLMQERFNSLSMLGARAALAWLILHPSQDAASGRGGIPKFGWIVIDFLNQVALLVEANKLDFTDANVAFSAHALKIWGYASWRMQLKNDWLVGVYAPFVRLCEEMKAVEPLRIANDNYSNEATISFWECESSLLESHQLKLLLNLLD